MRPQRSFRNPERSSTLRHYSTTPAAYRRDPRLRAIAGIQPHRIRAIAFGGENIHAEAPRVWDMDHVDLKQADHATVGPIQHRRLSVGLELTSSRFALRDLRENISLRRRYRLQSARADCDRSYQSFQILHCVTPCLLRPLDHKPADFHCQQKTAVGARGRWCFS